MIYVFNFGRVLKHSYTLYKDRRVILIPFPKRGESILKYPITPFCKIILIGHNKAGSPYLTSDRYQNGTEIEVKQATAGAIARWICANFTDPPIPSRPRLGPKIQLSVCHAATSRGEYVPSVHHPPRRPAPAQIIRIIDERSDVPEDTGEPFAKRLFEELKKRGLICDIIAYDDTVWRRDSERKKPRTKMQKSTGATITEKILCEIRPTTKNKSNAKYIFGEKEGTYYSENYAEWKERYRENPYSYWADRLSDPSLLKLSKLEILESLKKFIFLHYRGESSCYRQLSLIPDLIRRGGVFQWERIIDLLRENSVIARSEGRIDLAEILYNWFTLLMFYPDESESTTRGGGGYR